MDIRNRTLALDADVARSALADLLQAMTAPAFGSLPKREIDLLVFTTMTDIGIVAPDASPYRLMTELRVGRAKAMSLVFDRDLRRRDGAEIERLAVEAVANARFAANGGLFSIEVEDRLTREHLADRLRRLGHQSDASFNASLIRMGADAARDLVVDVIPAARHAEVLKALQEAGAPDETLKGAVGRALKAASTKAGEAATGAIVDAGKERITALIVGAAPAIVASFTGLF
jgi:hypothetical protein